MNSETIESELRRLQAFILSLGQRRDPKWRAELTRKIDDCTPGRWMSLDEAEPLQAGVRSVSQGFARLGDGESSAGL